MENPLIARLKALPASQLSLRKPTEPAKLETLERYYAVTFPADYRELKLFSDGLSLGSGGSGLDLELVGDTLAHFQDDWFSKHVPGMIVIGTDGGGSAYFYDPTNKLGKGPFAVFLVPMSALSFDESIFVGSSITDLIERVLAGEDLYERPPLGTNAPKG